MTTNKTQRELNLEYWGRVHDMCDAYNQQHGTNSFKTRDSGNDHGGYNSIRKGCRCPGFEHQNNLHIITNKSAKDSNGKRAEGFKRSPEN